MSVLVADTSGLVSLGTVAGESPDPFDICTDRYEVVVPETVVSELREIAPYDDEHADTAGAILSRRERIRTESVTLDDAFPLDDGENAAVTLANNLDAALLLCDEFTRLGVIHASLADSRLVTTPTLLSIFVRRKRLSSSTALDHLEAISDVRSWEGNSYVRRARSLLEEP